MAMLTKVIATNCRSHRLCFYRIELETSEFGDFDCDCGYDPELGYAVWQIDKLERVVALDVRSDDLKTLVLDENIPGRRSPQAYAQSMILAPQRQHD